MLRRLLLWILTLVLCAAVVRATAYAFSPVSSQIQWRLVDVPPHTSLDEIADRLQDMGIIRSRLCFLVAARLSGSSTHMQAGQYSLSPSMYPADIVSKLTKGDVATEWVVVPEGSTVRRIEQILEKHNLARPGRYDAAVRQWGHYYRSRLRLPESSLEGYLFPDTYKIPKGMPESGIVHMMVERFAQVRDGRLSSKIVACTNGLSFPETMILASLVEKEAQHDDERAHIAGVLINRLRGGIRLDCDASIEYALPAHKARLTHEDTLIDSPYNTYKHRGLPPTAICCPGAASIQAALAPAATHDLYYVARPDGYHIFSPTLAQHDEAIKQVTQMKKQDDQQAQAASQILPQND